jgi:uncharacterized membrane protein (UPF0127 family)
VRKVQVLNRTRQAVIAREAEMAETVWTRFVGLMGRKTIEPGTGLVIYPNNGVHMFFMRFPIDVLHLAEDGTVLKIVEGLKPWRVGPIVKKCKYTVELPTGTAKMTGTQDGDKIELIDSSGNKKKGKPPA